MDRIGSGWWLFAGVVLVIAGCARPSPSSVASSAVTIAEPVAPASASAPAPPPPGPRLASPIDVAADDSVWGSPTAPVELVEFSDLECPFCSRAVPTLAALKERYGPERLRVVFKHNPLPFHRGAKPAAQAARAVQELRGSAAFFEFVRLAFEGQRNLERENLLAWAAQVGAPRDAVATLMDAASTRARVEKDMALAAALGARGTPAYFINGVLVAGAQPLESFVAVVDAELAETRALLASGTPARDVAVVRTNENFVSPELPERGAPAPEDTTVWRVPVGKSAVQGTADALVTLVVFDDLQCPFCKRAQATLQELAKRYGSDLRIVYKHNPLPFHKNAFPAAMLAVEARVQKGDAAFFRVVDLAFESQDDLEPSGLKRIAAEAGLDVPRAVRAIESSRHRAVVEEDQDLARGLAARGTPHFFVNGRRIAGAQPVESFVKVIDAELAAAKEKVVAGLPRANVYAELMKTAKSPADPERKQVARPSGPRPARGPSNAPVVIEMFSDLECPFCRRVMPTVDAIVKKYPAQVRIVYRHLPLDFHENANLAARASMEAFAQKGDAAFWKMVPLIHGSADVEGPLTEDELAGYAKRVGVDENRFRAALRAGAHEQTIEEDRRAAAAAQIQGTPSFLVNGYFVAGAQPFEMFDRLIRRSLAEAGKGTGRAPP